MTNAAMRESISFKTYLAIATGAQPPKSKKQRKSDSKSSLETPTRTSPRLKRSTTVSPAKAKKKGKAKADTRKSLDVLSEVALSEAAQLKLANEMSKKDLHGSQASGSGT
ncbi:hypothetical protein Tco_0940454 [Tanacetum coccineum]|uniref:Uncharacterized protein n=1 Tax=Tanacetum coccineum TaxID=301880 RepID=A0ABQ5DU56_9ASTR